MKKLLLAFSCLFSGLASQAQTFCNPNGNLIIYTNYEGGILNIDIDENVPNIKIGVISYAALEVNIIGTYASNVTEVVYAGFNGAGSGGTGCGTVSATVINSTSSTNTINTLPPEVLSNPNGAGSGQIVCAYSCDLNTWQGGCNTADEVESYFLGQFPGSIVRSHTTQYDCYTTTQLISAGGTCCATPEPLSATIDSVDVTCNGSCDGSATAAGSGGTAPYTYQWTGGPATDTWSALCAGTYTVTVTDDLGATATATVTLAEPAIIETTIADTACMSYMFNGNTITQSGTYLDTLVATNGCDSFITLDLVIGTGVDLNVTQTTTTLTSAQAGATYQWLACPGNTIVPGATAQAYTPTASGEYSVVVSYQGCSDTSACVSVLTTNVAHVAGNVEFNVYPNPAHNQVYIESAVTDGAYRITDQLGKVVLTGNISGNKTVISLNELSAGLYFLNINEAQPIKLIKQ